MPVREDSASDRARDRERRETENAIPVITDAYERCPRAVVLRITIGGRKILEYQVDGFEGIGVYRPLVLLEITASVARASVAEFTCAVVSSSIRALIRGSTMVARGNRYR